MSQNIGLFAPRSLQAIGSHACMWLSKRGFEYFDLRTRQVTLVSQPMQVVVDGLGDGIIEQDTYAASIPCSLYWPAKQEYWCAFPTVRDTTYGINTYIYCYRPPTADRPPAQWMFRFHGVASTDRTADIDEDGQLSLRDYGEADSLHGLHAVVGDDGYLDLLDYPAPGLHFRVSSHYLNQAIPSRDTIPATFAIADGPFEPAAPWVGLYYDHQARCEQSLVGDEIQFTGTGVTRDFNLVEEVEWRLRSRPLTFGLQRRRKKLKRVRFTIENFGDTNGTVYVYGLVDGVRQSMHTVTVAPNSAPMEYSVRCGGRGRVLQAELVSSHIPCRITSLLVDVQLLEGDQA